MDAVKMFRGNFSQAYYGQKVTQIGARLTELSRK